MLVIMIRPNRAKMVTCVLSCVYLSVAVFSLWPVDLTMILTRLHIFYFFIAVLLLFSPLDFSLSFSLFNTIRSFSQQLGGLRS